MPLTPLPPSNTTRWRLHYSCGGLNHFWVIRTTAAVTNASVSTAFDDLLTALTTELYAITILGLDFAVSGSNIFNAATWTGAASYGSGVPSLEQATRNISFIGRTTNGRKARMFLYGFKQNFNNNMRVDTTENAALATCLAHLATYNLYFLGIDGLKPVYKNYVNVGYNDHWTKQVRKI
jgi:hypothetical protein